MKPTRQSSQNLLSEKDLFDSRQLHLSFDWLPTSRLVCILPCFFSPQATAVFSALPFSIGALGKLNKHWLTFCPSLLLSLSLQVVKQTLKEKSKLPKDTKIQRLPTYLRLPVLKPTKPMLTVLSCLGATTPQQGWRLSCFCEAHRSQAHLTSASWMPPLK